ncbi:DUF5799 family protein [Haloplanus sp.]|uniref:DUF5799 family protein n=1 Tax=Haloplanus sp. TaxID=1961696 RepID=UPI0026246B4C|nr:DUF5799 family protein [Haloplanus sp.]
MSDWTDRIVSDRMAVDREFSDRVRASAFNNQEWGLIMTAVEFEIEHPDDPDRARLVPDTENLPQMVPELEKVQGGMGPGGPTGGGDHAGSGGVFDAIRGVLGLSGDDDAERLNDAERLVGEYADALQQHLEDSGKWDDVRDEYGE